MTLNVSGTSIRSFLWLKINKAPTANKGATLSSCEMVYITKHKQNNVPF